MDELQQRIERNENSINEISMALNNILKTNGEFNNLISENINQLSSLGKTVEMIGKTIEDQKVTQEKSIKLIYIWLFCSMFLIILSFIMSVSGGHWLPILEKVTSWITCIFIIIGGGFSSWKAYFINKKIGYAISGAWALISTCYIGYVMLNFGSLHPEAGAIGFNIATSAQTLALVILVYFMGKNGR